MSRVRVQESGRAGRDGAPSLSMLYTSPADIDWCTRICKPQELPKVGAMVEFVSTVRCRRAKLLSYFDEKNGRCKEGVDELCDVCTSAAAVQKMQVEAVARRGFLVMPTAQHHCGSINAAPVDTNQVRPGQRSRQGRWQRKSKQTSSCMA